MEYLDKKKKKLKRNKVIFYCVVGLLALGFMALLLWILIDTEESKQTYSSCIDIYELNSCELYQCRANNSVWIPNKEFNLRNYEVCKIILNNNMTFEESLDLLEVITYPRQ